MKRFAALFCAGILMTALLAGCQKADEGTDSSLTPPPIESARLIQPEKKPGDKPVAKPEPEPEQTKPGKIDPAVPNNRAEEAEADESGLSRGPVAPGH